jgi:alkylhydroperoxidase/carboxymuconolactone decarboxylase family protein YurZ
MALRYQPIEKYLDADKLAGLRNAFAAGPPPALSAPLLTVYEPSKDLVGAVGNFYAGCVDDSAPPPRDVLSAQDRERCIIALLCARREDVELSIHIYLALMLGVSILEIANVILLAAMYTGIDNLSRGLFVYTLTLQTLACQTTLDPQFVVDSLVQAIHTR